MVEDNNQEFNLKIQHNNLKSRRDDGKSAALGEPLSISILGIDSLPCSHAPYLPSVSGAQSKLPTNAVICLENKPIVNPRLICHIFRECVHVSGHESYQINDNLLNQLLKLCAKNSYFI